LRRALGEDRASELALDGGDDYELCFSAKSADEKRIAELTRAHDVRVTRIGELSAGAGLTCVKMGQRIPYRDRGYRHF
ncbi:MAG: thiamine-phosphate kinase, partial [Woeseiaceae bacterium]